MVEQPDKGGLVVHYPESVLDNGGAGGGREEGEGERQQDRQMRHCNDLQETNKEN